jgi:hypothetical protein
MLPTANSHILRATLASPGEPIVFEERASRSSGAALITMLSPLFAMAIVPATLFAIVASLGESESVSIGTLAAALYCVAALVAVPILRLILEFGRHRIVAVEGNQVRVSEVGPFISRTRTQDLSDFSGIVHRVRTTLSGVAHDLLLVDRDSGAKICIHRADRIGPQTIALAAERLGLPILSVAEAGAGTIRLPARQAPASMPQTALAA